MARLLSVWLVCLFCGSLAGSANNDVAAWIKILEKGEDQLAQEEALENLGKSGPAARAALPILKKIATDVKSPLRKKSVLAIFRIDPQSDVSPAVLLDGLKDAAAQEKRQSAVLLARGAAQSPRLLRQILDVLPDLDAPTRTLLVNGLMRLPATAAPVLQEAFSHKQPAVRAAAVTILGEMPAEAAKALPALRGLLKDADLGVRLVAARLVWTHDADRDQKPLVAIFKDAAQDEKLRAELFFRLPGLQPSPQDPALFELVLRHGSPEQRMHAITRLAELGKPPRELFPVLRALLHNEPAHRRSTLSLMAQVCPGEVKGALSDFLDLLRNETAARDLHELSRLLALCGAEAVEPLLELLKKDLKDNRTAGYARRLRIQDALAGIGEPAVNPVRKLLDAETPEQVKAALYILGRLGTNARSAVPRVVQLLNDPPLSSDAAACLAGIGAAARVATADLLRLAQNDRQQFGRAVFIETLLAIFPAQDELLPALRKVAAAPDATPLNRLKALEAVWLWQGDAKLVAAGLKDILARDAVYPPHDCWNLLSQLGPELEPVLPELFAHLSKQSVMRERVVALLAETAPRLKHRPSAQELEPLNAILQEKRNTTPSGYNSLRLNAALVLIAFEHNSDKALAVVKEELARARIPPPVPAMSCLSALGSKLKGIAPELLTQAARLSVGHHHYFHALLSIDPAALKEQRAEFEKRLSMGGPAAEGYAWILVQLEENHSAAWQFYEKILTTPNQWGVATALRNLELLGPKAKRLAPLVEKLLKDPRLVERQAAAVCLWRLTGDASKSVPVLVETLKHPSAWRNAGYELTRLGGAARAAVPELMLLAETQAGTTAQGTRACAFQIDRAAALAWWRQRDAK